MRRVSQDHTNSFFVTALDRDFSTRCQAVIFNRNGLNERVTAFRDDARSDGPEERTQRQAAASLGA